VAIIQSYINLLTSLRFGLYSGNCTTN